jgi:hypothetical protein
MTLEKGFIHRHIFYANNPLVLHHFDNPINQKKRIAMRQDLLNRFDIQLFHLLSSFFRSFHAKTSLSCRLLKTGPFGSIYLTI